MSKFKDLSDAHLLAELTELITQDRETTASLVACIAEVDARRLYLPAGFSSMYAYCVEGLRLSEDAAYKRIQAARAARVFPALIPALADGRLHLSGACLLAPHLTAANAGELITAATHLTRAGIEQLLARRFPRPEALRLDEGISALPRVSTGQTAAELAPGQVDTARVAPAQIAVEASQLAPGQVATAPRDRVAPLSPQRFSLQITISGGTHDKLRYAQALLGHSIPSGEVGLVLDRALDALIVQLERRKFAATSRPRRTLRPARGGRSIPALVRRAVWERDRGRCTFVGDGGHRCTATRLLEFDHIDPVARGGQATVERMRLRCRAHNQYEAEQVFGGEFMRNKRRQARQASAERRARSARQGSPGSGDDSNRGNHPGASSPETPTRQQAP